VIAPEFLLQHHEAVLSNGLRVVLVPAPHIHSAVAALYLRVGSRFETRDNNGISHFLEHMMFRGTATMPSAHAQALAFERLGTTPYAATHVDHGVMSVAVPPSNLERVLALLGEVTLHPRFTDIETERGIVREEILEDLDDEGRQIDPDNLARALMYGEHPLGFTITGDDKTIDRFDEAMLREHHARHYTAENAVLSIAGRLGDLDRCVRSVEQHFGAMPRGRRVAASPPPPTQTGPRARFVENPSSQTDLRVAFRAPSERDRTEPAAELLLRVLDDGMSTRLYERICDRMGLCYDVSGMFEAYEDDGVIDFAAGSQHESALVVVKELFLLLREIAKDGPTEDELTKAIDRHRWSIESMLDNPDALAGFYGLTTLANLARTPLERHVELASVTRAEVRELATEVLSPARLNLVAVGLLGEADQRRLDKLARNFSS
jgi:predicted Zn-dependent peptidase